MRTRRNRYDTPACEPFASERELCDLLRDVSTRVDKREPWRCYPEQGGWDLLLVLPGGEQIGVQAKLRAGFEVLSQAMRPRRRTEPGPDVHAVLVPEASIAFCDVARELEILVIRGNVLRNYDGHLSLGHWVSRAPRRLHDERCWLPPYVPDAPAGVPAPRTVSPWKVGAARICARLRSGEHVTAAEIRAAGAGSMSTWRRWLTAVPGTSRPAKYKPLPWARLPDLAFPDVAAGLGLPRPT
jgi:hypothetical protein